ncbi:hypothetical protein CJI82_00042 [Candidozyma auris]
MSYSDFTGEFNSIKRASLEELKRDKFVQRLQSERKPRTVDELSSEEELFFDAPEVDSAPKPKVEVDAGPVIKPRKRLVLSGIEELKQAREIEQRPKKRVLLTGIQELREANEKKPKKRVKLITMMPHEGANAAGTNEGAAQTLNSGRSADQVGPDGQKNSKEEVPEKNVQDGNENKHRAPDSLSDCNAGDIELMKRIIMSQLTGREFPFFEECSLAPTYKEIYKMLQHTICDREGTSGLLIGPRGTGKSLVVNRALENLQKQYGRSFITVKLNATHHSDDKLALREIARQLDVNATSDDANKRTFEQRAISDTFTNILLALDSKTPGGTPIVFVIDEIERFTGSTKQTLLYNLFDLSQSSKVPICVLGISTKITTRELLEKRVRSRFSQRMITTHESSSIEEFWNNAKLSLLVHPTAMESFKDKQYPIQWNEKVEEAFSRPSQLTRVVYRIFFSTKKYQQFNNCFMLPVSLITPVSPFLDDGKAAEYLSIQSHSPVQSIVKSLSNTELLLTIAAARWIAKADTPNVNFNLAYKEYTEMMKQFNAEATTLSSNTSHLDNFVLAGIKVSQRIWSAKVMRDSWDKLYRHGLLFDIITSNNEVNANNNHNMYKLVVLDASKTLQLDVTLEELGQIIPEGDLYKKLTKL